MPVPGLFIVYAVGVLAPAHHYIRKDRSIPCLIPLSLINSWNLLRHVIGQSYLPCQHQPRV